MLLSRQGLCLIEGVFLALLSVPFDLSYIDFVIDHVPQKISECKIYL